MLIVWTMEQPHTLKTKPDTWMPLAIALARVTRRLKMYSERNKETEQQQIEQSRSAYDRFIENKLKEFAALERRYGK